MRDLRIICGRAARAVAAAMLACGLAACQTLDEEAAAADAVDQAPRPQIELARVDAPDLETAEAGEDLTDTPESRRAMLPQFRNQPTDDGCNVEMATVWRETSRGVYAVEVRSRGDDCQTAEVSLALRGPTMRVLWRETFTASDLAGFEAATDARRMRSRLVSWITSGGSLNLTARQLPPAGRVSASGGAFVIAEGIQPAIYEGVRRADGPIFCYIAGLDRNRCVALVNEGSAIVAMGAQLYGDGA